MKIPETKRVEIDRIVRQVVEGYRPEKIILFGSYAYGEPDEDSDLDLLIIKKTSERFMDRLIHVRKIVSDPERSIPFGPIVLTPDEIEERLAIGDQFIGNILGKGKMLYSAESEVKDGKASERDRS